MARFQVICPKVSINPWVSPVLVDKACHTPYIQNGVEKSALGILRIPIMLAFSHKELMVPILTWSVFYCQNDEMSTMCTPWYIRVTGHAGLPVVALSWHDLAVSEKGRLLTSLPAFS